MVRQRSSRSTRFGTKGVQTMFREAGQAEDPHVDSCPPLLLLIRYVSFGFHLFGRSTRLCAQNCRIWHWGYSNTLPARAKPPCTVRLSQVDERFGSCCLMRRTGSCCRRSRAMICSPSQHLAMTHCSIARDCRHHQAWHALVTCNTPGQAAVKRSPIEQEAGLGGVHANITAVVRSPSRVPPELCAHWPTAGQLPRTSL